MAQDIGPLQSSPGQSIGPLAPAQTSLTVLPAGIASSCLLGSPNVMGGDQTVSPGGIASSCVLGSPTLSFPNVLQPAGIPSSFAAGIPTLVGVDQTLVPFGIPSSFVAGTPTVLGGSAQIVLPNGILSSCVLGSPSIAGPLSNIITPSILSSFVAGIPGLVGGANGVQLFIANQPVKYLVPGGLSWPRYGDGGAGGGTGAATGGALTITQTAIGRATCSFDLHVGDGSGYVPRASQICTIMENGRKLFAGCLKSVSSDPRPGSFTDIGFHIDAVDKSSICDNRVVIKTYPLGTDIQGMILDIVQNFLNGEGITTQEVNVAGTLDSAMVFNTVTVSNAFDQITSLTGAQWWVDFNGVLHFLIVTDSPMAPFGLTTTSGNFRNFVSTETTINYANKFYAVSNLVVLPGGASGESAGGAITVLQFVSSGFGWNIGDTFSITGGDGTATGVVTSVSGTGGVVNYTLTAPGTGYSVGTASAPAVTGTGTGLVLYVEAVSPAATGASGAVRTETYVLNGSGYQVAAFNAGLAPGYILLELPIAALVSVTVNGTSIPVYPLSDGIQPGNGYYWFNGDAQAKVIFPEGFTPGGGATVVIGYIPVYQNATVQTGTPLSGTCGSGLVEGVIQVPNIDVQSQLDAIAAAYLVRNGTIPYLISYETDEPGLFVGQQQSINLPLVGLGTTTIYITTLTMQIESQNRGANPVSPFGSAFRYVVEATTQQNQGNWLTWFERFVARTNYPLPLARYEQADMVLAPGGSLAGGTVLTNSYVVKNAGTIFGCSAQANIAPVGQNLFLQFFINGVALLGTATGNALPGLMIPAGSTDVVYVASGQVPPGATVFKGDKVTCSATYQVLGTSPTPAGSISFDLFWSY